jgi:organic hydroperoxide reductase OsmC/OhrA
MSGKHRYEIACTWTGDRGDGTVDYRSYDRLYNSESDGRPTIHGSSDPAFRGDPERWNPELLLVAALSQCHLLSYLHRCAVGGVTVVGYSDTAEGFMVETADGGGRFEEVVLRPVVTVADESMIEPAARLHAEASARCFIASSVNFPVRHEPRIVVAKGSAAAA